MLPALRLISLAVCALGFTGATLASNVSQRPFTVADSIAWTRIVNLSSDSSANPVNGTALFSPDRSQFVLHARKGDLRTNEIEEQILVFKSSEIDTFLAESAANPPQPRTTIRIKVGKTAGLVSAIQWLDNRRFGFIAEGDNGFNQAFSADAQTGAVSQLTHSATSVSSFAATGDTVMYYAYQTLPRVPPIGVVADRTLADVIFPRDPESAPSELFERDLSTGKVTRVNAPPMRLLARFQRIWISPSGKRAVIFVPATDAPAGWSSYRIPDYERFGYTPDKRFSDPGSPDGLYRTRYALVDLKENSVTPLLDAPSGGLAGNGTPPFVAWLDDEKNVIVSDTYLPIEDVDPRERAERVAKPAIALVGVKSGQAEPLFWEAVITPQELATGKRLAFRILDIGWNEAANALTVVTRHTDPTTKDRVIETRIVERHPEGWLERPVIDRPQGPRLSVDLRQSLSDSPKIYATLGDSRKILFDPNPQSGNFKFGRTARIAWTDTDNKIDWQGGVVYPPDYDPRRRYPLIVQTHGFQSDEFLLDGPGDSTTAMAAQVFAGAGFLVLQIADNAKASTDDEREGPLYAAGYHAGIAALISQGVADPSRIGMITWSRTGFEAIYFLAHYPDFLAALNISDADQPGYLSGFLLSVNLPPDIAFEQHRMVGGIPDFERPADWFSRDPTYRLQATSTAVRIESDSGSTGVLPLWETYAVLKTSRRPVDFVYFPNGDHNQVMPVDRMGSQGGNVDWFDFWLNGREDPDPAKAEQYARWRKLRDQREANARANRN